jgi:type VI secretion system protein
MSQGSLFERLTNTLAVGRGQRGNEVVFQSIANNLSNILSTNAGSAQTVDDYGRPDLNNAHLSLKDSIDAIEAFIAKSVKKYEPRLYKSQVHISKEQLNMNKMNIHIVGYVFVDGQSQKINFKADLLSNGKVKVYKDEN